MGYQFSCDLVINAVNIKKVDQSLFRFVETVGIGVTVKIETCFVPTSG